MSNLEERHEATGDRDSGTRRGHRHDANEIRREHKMLGVLFEEERRNHMRRPDGQQHAERAAGHRDEDAVREQLFGELAPPGAERDANRRLVRAGGRPCHQKRRHVGACDEEHGARCRAQQLADARQAASRFRRHAGVGQHSDRVGIITRRIHRGLRVTG